MHIVSVTIGRGAGDRRMSAEDWMRFRVKTNKILKSQDHDAVEAHLGYGLWQGETEESFKATILRDLPMTAWEVKRLKEELSKLAQEFEQDAIALTLGESELIS